VQKLLDQASLYKGKKEYVIFLHKADTAANGDLSTQAMVNRKLGVAYFSTDPDKSIHHFSLATSYYRIIDDKPNIALCLQNTAFAFDEGKFSIPAALPYAEQAAAIWGELNDTLQLANMYKYIGLLQGKTSRGALAKQNINKAIDLYRAKHNDAGVAVSWHNMAIVYQFARQYDSAFAYLASAKQYWQDKDSSRIFEINNLLIELDLAIGRVDSARSVYAENRLLYNDKYFWRDRLTFYRLAIEYFRRIGDEKSAVANLEKYEALHSALQKQGIVRN
jgi:tetratricopeptide (TPR) repeat protein